MNANLQPPPLPVRTGRPYRRPPLIGRSTKSLLILVAFLLFVRLWDDLRTAEGRSFLWKEAKSLLSSPDSYIALVVILVNSLLYSLVIKHVYPTTRTTLRGLALAVTMLKGDDHRDSQPGEMTHFFMIFVFPVLVIAAGFAEYQSLKAWLLPQ